MLVDARFPFRKSAKSANGNGCEILVLSDLSMVWQLRNGMFRGFSLGEFGGVKPLIQLALSALYVDTYISRARSKVLGWCAIGCTRGYLERLRL